MAGSVTYVSSGDGSAGDPVDDTTFFNIIILQIATRFPSIFVEEPVLISG